MKDNFSRSSEAYKAYRPVYPGALFEFIISKLASKKIAWDAGTGNGQAAAALAGYFDTVIATDISPQQLLQAPAMANIIYKNEPAEKTSISTGSVDLVTVSQALHWFHTEQFYDEVKRVAAPGAILAVWTYNLLQISPGIDKLTRHFHDTILGPYWDAERKHVANGYEDIPFPFYELPAPPFQIETDWTITELAGYLKTWSAVHKFIGAVGWDPVDQLLPEIEPLWPGGTRHIRFPLTLKIARVH